jgi:hypothetical protein
MHACVQNYAGFLGSLFKYVSLHSSCLVMIGLVQVGMYVRILFGIYLLMYLRIHTMEQSSS